MRHHRSGKKLGRFTGHAGGVISVAFAPDGQTVLSGSQDHTVRLWSVETGEEVRRFGLTPRVALLSHSSFGATDTPTSLKMRQALACIRCSWAVASRSIRSPSAGSIWSSLRADPSAHRPSTSATAWRARPERPASDFLLFVEGSRVRDEVVSWEQSPTRRRDSGCQRWLFG